MKCSKCGYEINEGDKFCRECGQVVESTTPEKEVKEKTKNVEEPKEEVKEEVKTEVTTVTNKPEEKRIVSSMANDTFFCLCSIICYIACPLLTGLFAYLDTKSDVFSPFVRIPMLLPFAAYGLAIYAKVKYPESKFAKILLIIYIVLFVLGIILMIIAVIACAIFLRDCLEGCQGLGSIISLLFG